jgi:hypothetical protein
MKLKLIVSILFVALLLSCETTYEGDEADDNNSESSQILADDLVESLMDYESGTLADINELNNQFEDQTVETPDSRTVQISVNKHDISGFTWNSTENAMERTGNNIEVDGLFFKWAINNYNVKIYYFTSDSVPEDYKSGAVDPRGQWTSIKSLKYVRTYSAYRLNKSNNNRKDISIEVDLNITQINDGIEGTVVNGTRTATKEISRVRYEGEWINTQTWKDVNVYRTFKDGVIYDELDGTVDFTYVGYLENVNNGNKYDWDNTYSVEFERSRTITVTIDDETVTIDVVVTDQ